MKLHVFGVALVSAVAVAVSAPAKAAGSLTRTFVSAAGNDSNSCTITQPCASFAAAYAAVQANGIIAALDPGKYGPLTITMPVTVNGNGWAVITAPASGNGIAINVGSGVVILTGLEIDGAASGHSGIVFDAGSGLEIADCIIRNMTDTGIFIDAPGHTNIRIINTKVTDNPTAGITIQPGPNASTQATDVTIDHVGVFKSGYGIYLGGNPSGQYGIYATISNSTVAGSYSAGIAAVSNSTSGTTAAIRDTVISSEENVGAPALGISAAGGANTYLTISRILAFGNSADVQLSGGSIVRTMGNNDLVSFFPVNGGSLTPVQPQ